MEEEEGPAFMSFSGEPGEDVSEFVSSVEALRKNFKWSSQVAYCYARTMIKGDARKTLLLARGAGDKSSDSKGSKAAEEVVGPSSWANLKGALLFEFSGAYVRERQLRDLLSTRQLAGESGSEYSERFIDTVSKLVVDHALDTQVLTQLYIMGLRSSTVRMQLVMRRPNTIDKAIGCVAPDQMYRIAKVVPLLAPPPLGNLNAETPNAAANQFASSHHHHHQTTELMLASPATFEEHESFEGSVRDMTPDTLACTFTLPALKYDSEDEEDDAGESLRMAGEKTAGMVRGATSKGATFSLDDDDAGYSNVQYGTSNGTAARTRAQSSSPWLAGQSQQQGYGSGMFSPDTYQGARPQQHQHRQSMSTYGRAESALALETNGGYQYTTMQRYGTQPRSSSSASLQAARGSAFRTFDLSGGTDDGSPSELPPYPPSAADRAPSASSSSGDVEKEAKSAADLNCLADQLEHLSSMLRVQSDARRRRPRLCYRCRQKGHMAADCPLPEDIVVPNQQQREKLGLPVNNIQQQQQQPGQRTLSRSNTLPSGRSSRASSRAGFANGGRNGSSSSPGNGQSNGSGSRRRHTQSRNRPAKQTA
ncbi:hypothetical protein FBU59_001457 [Linderina macrospora]|uniref:Uncharacterized protein n=1 Tax=Linderina macrospora TaxID=4868 RepID=A0ACC1JE70_9FUNG|nr:hypothetical protein FBU59_001457 [Linderina macrospora]